MFYSDSHCISPPDPPAEKFLKKQFNILSPPAHGESVMYVCDAGANYNRFVSDFNKWNYTITCTKNNTFVEEPDVPWPTCADGKWLKILYSHFKKKFSHLLPKSYKLGNIRNCTHSTSHSYRAQLHQCSQVCD